MGGINFTHYLGYPIITDHHKNFSALKTDKSNKFYKMVKIQSSKTLSCRPRFYKWNLSFELEFDRNIIDATEILTILETMTNRIGLGVWTPGSPKPGSHGKFEIDLFNHTNEKGKSINMIKVK